MDPLRRRLLATCALAAPAISHAQSALGQAQPAAGDAAGQAAKARPLPAIGSSLALPAIERLDGTRFEPRDADGRVLLLYWWASWCPFCAVTTPYLEALWRAQRESSDQAAACRVHRRQGYSFSVSLVRGCHFISRRSMRPTRASSRSAKTVSTRMPAITVLMSKLPSACRIR